MAEHGPAGKGSHSFVDTLHPLLIEKRGQIRRCRDAYKGTDAIKNASPSFSSTLVGTDEEYLPKLSGQDKGEYEHYKTRAIFYAAMARTVTALVGAIDRKPPEIDGADSLEDWRKDVTGTGVNFDEFMKELETETMISGRVIVVIDRMNSENNKPYLVWYKSEDCINWFTEDYTEFDKKLSKMIFRESYMDIDDDNSYLQIQCDQYREYILGPSGDVTVNLWRPEKKATVSDTLSGQSFRGNDVLTGEKPEYKIHETYKVTKRGKPLGFLPVVPLVADGSPLEMPKPPLVDLVDINLSHYRNSADYEHGLHWTALPTPWFSGLNDRGSAIKIGSGSAIILPDPASKAGFLEFQGTGLKSIAESMTKKEELMSALGARMLSSSMDQSTSAEVVRINVSGEVAALQNVAKAISRGLTRLLRMVALWEGKGGIESIEVRLNEDYVDTKLEAPDITALLGAYQGGVISLDTLLWNFDQGERLPLGRTIDEEIALIESDIDKEAEFAMGFEEDNVEFAGNKFKSIAGSEIAKEGLAMDQEKQKDEKALVQEDVKMKKQETALGAKERKKLDNEGKQAVAGAKPAAAKKPAKK